MSLPEEASQFPSLCGAWPDELLAGFRDQCQLDFDIAFFDRVLRRAPGFVDVLRCQGELLSRKGLHDQAVTIDRRLATLLPRDAIVHYNLACSLAQVGEIRAAVDALRQALRLGYRDVAYLETDSDLDNLRGDPEYQALLSACKASPPQDKFG